MEGVIGSPIFNVWHPWPAVLKVPISAGVLQEPSSPWYGDVRPCQWTHYSDEVCTIATVDISNASTVLFQLGDYNTILMGSYIIFAGLRLEKRCQRCNSGAQAASLRQLIESIFLREKMKTCFLRCVVSSSFLQPFNVEKLKPAFAWALFIWYDSHTLEI